MVQQGETGVPSCKASAPISVPVCTIDMDLGSNCCVHSTDCSLGDHSGVLGTRSWVPVPTFSIVLSVQNLQKSRHLFIYLSLSIFFCLLISLFGDTPGDALGLLLVCAQGHPWQCSKNPLECQESDPGPLCASLQLWNLLLHGDFTWETPKLGVACLEFPPLSKESCVFPSLHPQIQPTGGPAASQELMLLNCGGAIHTALPPCTSILEMCLVILLTGTDLPSQSLGYHVAQGKVLPEFSSTAWSGLPGSM